MDWKPLIRMIDAMTGLLVFLFILAVLFVLAVRGRCGHKGLEQLQHWYYAHRGLHDETRPENSMSAFCAALEHGYGIELDVHLLADGNLAVIHDSLLKRTTGAEGRIEDLTTAQLQEYHLEGTSEVIPTFRQVLELYQGKAPLIVELKPSQGNYGLLAKTACEVLDEYDVAYCVESFDPRCIYWLKKHRPDVIRGQLTENYFKSGGKLPAVLKFLLANQLENFLTMPDFVAYRFSDRRNLSNWIVRKIWHIQGVTWTIRSKADFDTAVQEGYLPIFEGFIP